MATMLTAKEVAAKLDTDARTLRKFLRAEITANGGKIGEDSPGKGSRYAIEAKSVASLKRRFTAWVEAKQPKTEEVAETPDEG